MTPDAPETSAAEPAPAQIAASAIGMTLMQGVTRNKHAECDRTVINEVLDRENNDGWSLVGQPTIIGSHVDMWFEKVVYEEEAAAEVAPPVAEPPAAEEPEVAAGVA